MRPSLLHLLPLCLALAGTPAGAQVTAERFMVVAGHQAAAEAGREVLAEGGSAVDAMVAVQMVLNLVEPQSSGIGGGAFLLYLDGATGELLAYDGRETAPAAATPELFLDAAGQPMPFIDAVVGGRSVGVPGTLALMELAHERHGRLAWARLMEPAIALAEGGFAVSPRLAELLAGDAGARLAAQPAAAAYFLPGGKALAEGQTITNPDFAEMLRAIAEEGSAALYDGPIAAEIALTVASADNPGGMTVEDLATYEVAEREPVCHDYREHRICGFGPPSSGALTVGQILGILGQFDLATLGPDSAEAWHLFAEASKLAYADRGLYIADLDFVEVPAAGMLQPGYLAERAQLIDPTAAMATPAAPGMPAGAAPLTPDGSAERPGTSHVSIVDAEGNAVALTTTIEGNFGAHQMVRGFLLNNELTDFSFAPEADGRPVANRVEPGKRPRSSMAPTMVFAPDGRLELVIGSPGGGRIIPFVAATLIGVLDWGLDIQQAVELPHVANGNGPTLLEAGTPVADLADELEALGHQVSVAELLSGLNGIQVTAEGRLIGGADPRRRGVALGE